MSRAYFTAHVKLKVSAYDSQFDPIFFVPQFSHLYNSNALITGLFLSHARQMWRRKTWRQHASSYLLQPLSDITSAQSSSAVTVTRSDPNCKGGWEM